MALYSLFLLGVTWYSAQNIDRQGVQIIVVGFTDNPELTNLRLISSQPQLVLSYPLTTV